MKKFLITYWLTIIILFTIFYWDISPIARIINHIQTDFISYTTSLLLDNGMMKNHEIIINKHYSLIIENACNGMVPYLFFLSSIIAFPSTIKHKIVWGILGYITINIINIFRIWVITQMVLKSKSNFSLAHDWIGNILLISVSLALFILFVKTRYNYKKG
ncbi:MAG: hypothetical protein GXO60_05030 [Epsilonproteobacteria bacterium]|nr:hypothetical protein [Campylobacterota bacterium]